MKRTIIAVFAFLLFFSCAKKSDKEQYALEIAKMERSVLQDSSGIKPKEADSLVALYKGFAELYPEDSLSPAYLYRAADVLANRKECLKAVEVLESLIQKYPKDAYAEQAAFLKGIVYQEACLNKEKAAECFKSFIASYPDSPHIKDAEGLLQLSEAENELDLVHKWEEAAKMQ